MHEAVGVGRLLERKRARDERSNPSGAEFVEQQHHPLAKPLTLAPQMTDVQAEQDGAIT